MPKRAIDGQPKPALNERKMCATNRLDFESLPFVQSAIDFTQVLEYSCVTALPKDDQSCLEFRLDKTDAYIDLSRAMVYYCFQVVHKDNSDIADDETVSIINNIGYGMFESVDLYISDQKVTKSESHYPWWTYLYNLLYTTEQYCNTILEAGNCWYRDTPGQFDNFDLSKTVANDGYRQRRSSVSGRGTWLGVPLLLNTTVSRLIPAQTEITLKFNRAPTNLVLLASNELEYKIRITDAKVQVPRINMFDHIHKNYEKILNSKGFLYPGLNPIVRTKTISSGDQNIDWTPFTGKLPQRIYIFQIAQSAYNGQLDRNPYNFQNFMMNKIQVFKNGRSLPMGQGLKNLPGDLKQLRMFQSTASAINSPDTFKIRYYEYVFGYFVIAVDISSDLSTDCDYDNPERYGSLRLVIDYAKALDEATTIFCVGEIQEILKIDSNRNPTFVQP